MYCSFVLYSKCVVRLIYSVALNRRKASYDVRAKMLGIFKCLLCIQASVLKQILSTESTENLFLLVYIKMITIMSFKYKNLELEDEISKMLCKHLLATLPSSYTVESHAM